MSDSSVIYERRGEVGWIILDRPDETAITTGEQLRASIDEAEKQGVAEVILFLPYDAASAGRVDLYEAALLDLLAEGLS